MSRSASAARAEPRGLSERDFAERFTAAGWADEAPLLLAVSGGPDSIALMQAAAAWRARRSGGAIFVATVDHAIRPDSCREAEAVGMAARAIGLPHAILTWSDHAPRVSQEAARHARYRLLDDHARALGIDRMATAHTRDDQAETVLMRLADGSGLTGIAGMAPMTGRDGIRHHRPFLPFSKADLVATCLARGWSFVQDASNTDTRFARTRWRGLASALAAEGLDASRMARLADRARRAEVALGAMAATICDRVILSVSTDGASVAFTALADDADEIALRVFQTALLRVETREFDGRHLRLDRVEAAFFALRAAALSGIRLRRTLAGRLLELDRDGTLAIRAEKPRRRGRAAAAGAPHLLVKTHSLGIRNAGA